MTTMHLHTPDKACLDKLTYSFYEGGENSSAFTFTSFAMIPLAEMYVFWIN